MMKCMFVNWCKSTVTIETLENTQTFLWISHNEWYELID